MVSETASSTDLILEHVEPRKRRTKLVPALTEALRREIREGRLRPGDRLPTEAELGLSAGVSRTVVREAVASLRAEGLVETRQGAGAFVTPSSTHVQWIGDITTSTVEDIIAVLELRMAIEIEAATLAAVRRTQSDLEAIEQALLDFSAQRHLAKDTIEADARFHRSLALATHNVHFVKCLDSLGEFAFPRRHLPAALRQGEEISEHLERAEREHKAIYDAVMARDVTMAASTMRLHLGGSKSRYAAMARRADD
jgi:GntR family transcriptional regulator, transcriptional repressor for pyruvate dehydrogenase complex